MTAPSRAGQGGCSRPIESSVLMDYWLAALSSETEQAVEEHLFTCDACGDRLRESIVLADGLRALARSGSMVVIVSDEFVKHAEAMGQRVRAYSPARGGSVQCTVAADDDLLVARLAADLSGASRVDLSWCDGQGVELQRMADIPLGESGTIICQKSITFAKASPSNRMIARLVAVETEGSERLLGEYAFHHTRTIPGVPGLE